MNTPVKNEMLKAVEAWVREEMMDAGLPISVEEALKSELATIRNSNGWMLETLKTIARTLEQPNTPDIPNTSTMLVLPEHAKKVMAELNEYRKKK